MQQDSPNSVQIEFTEGCNLRCSFCGLQGIREIGTKNYKYMTEETLSHLCEDIRLANWNPRMEIAMHGEPTMNPDMLILVKTIRRHLPKAYIMMTSNGGGLQKETGRLIHELRIAGLNTLAIDQYDHAPKLAERIRDACVSGDWAWYEYPSEKDGNPHRRHTKFMVSIMQDPSREHSAKTPSLSNHCGAAFPKNDSAAGKRCHRPFRELSVRWDGNVAICCNDWRGEYKIGNTNDTPVYDLWQNSRFYAARQKLYHGQRDFGPCDGCDSRSYRVGLLPDKYGKETLPEPDDETYRALNEALSGESYTPSVKREWEK